MRKTILLGTIGIWFLIAILAVINGITRDLIYSPIIGGLYARMMSTFILIAIIIMALFVYIKNAQPTKDEAIKMGILLTAFTMIFDFSLGLLEGKSIQWLINDYNVFQGKLFPLVLLTTLAAPYLLRNILREGRE